MDIEKYNEKQNEIAEAKAEIIDAIHSAMARHNLDNTDATSLLAKLTSEWAHYAFCDVQNMKGGEK